LNANAVGKIKKNAFKYEDDLNKFGQKPFKRNIDNNFLEGSFVGSTMILFLQICRRNTIYNNRHFVVVFKKHIHSN
jgi:hypothetical protein